MSAEVKTTAALACYQLQYDHNPERINLVASHT